MRFSSLSLLFLSKCFITTVCLERSDIGKFSLFNESRLKEICTENDTKQLFWFTKQFTCLSVWINHYEQESHRSLHESCWFNHTHMQYPGNDTKKWLDFFCTTISPYILMNTVDHCFLRNVTEDGREMNDQLTQRYIQCSAVNLNKKAQVYGQQLQASTLIGADEREDEEWDRKRLCTEKADFNRNHVKYQVKNLKCLDTVCSGLNLTDLMRRCWSILLDRKYPSSDDEWIEFYCSDKYAYVALNFVEQCMKMHRFTRFSFTGIRPEFASDIRSSYRDECTFPQPVTLDQLGTYVQDAKEKIENSVHNDICINCNQTVINSFIRAYPLCQVTKIIVKSKNNSVGLDHCFNSYLGIATPKSESDLVKAFCSIPYKTWKEKLVKIFSCIYQIYLSVDSDTLDKSQDDDMFRQIDETVEGSLVLLDEDTSFEDY